MSQFTESIVEDAAFAWQESLGYAVLHGPDISPGGDTLTPALCFAPSVSLFPEGEGEIFGCGIGRSLAFLFSNKLHLFSR